MVGVSWWADWVGAGLGALVLLVWVVVRVWRTHYRSERKARLLRETLGEADRQLEGGAPGDQVTLRGILRLVAGEPGTPERPGVESRRASTHRQAAKPQVALELSGGLLPVRGTIDLALGTREQRPRRGFSIYARLRAGAAAQLARGEQSLSGDWELLSWRRALMRAVRDGDEIIVQGALDRTSGAQAGGYRQAQGELALVSAPRAPIVMAAVHAERIKVPWWRQILYLPVMAGLLAFGCVHMAGVAWEDELVGCRLRCPTVGDCSMRPAWTGTSLFFPFRCHAASDEDCAPCDQCKTRGRCRARDGVCVVERKEDCRSSSGCRIGGRCGLGKSRAGRSVCTVGSAEDCARSTGCRDLGRCRAKLTPPSSRCVK